MFNAAETRYQMSQSSGLSWESIQPYSLQVSHQSSAPPPPPPPPLPRITRSQVGGHTATFFELPDGTLLKLVKSSETAFWTKTINSLPSVPDFMPVCRGHGVLPARDGVDKEPREFVLLENVIGVM